jgi:hypothetical protein
MKVSGAVAMADHVEAFGIDWRQVNDEPLEYAIQQGPNGDEFVQLINGQCLKRERISFDMDQFTPSESPFDSITPKMRGLGLEVLKPGGLKPGDNYEELVDVVERIYRVMIEAKKASLAP